MGKVEHIKGSVALASNSPGMPTGYGTQGQQLVERMLKHRLKVASFSNYGRDGNRGKLKIAGQFIDEYPKGITQYSADVVPHWFHDFAQQSDNKTAVLTLYDAWVYEQFADHWKFDGKPIPVISWVPLDHISLPPAVRVFLQRDNVTPVTMAPHGQRQLEAASIDSVYIPHAIDLDVYKPRDRMSIAPVSPRQYLLGDKSDDVFLVGMVSANKANGVMHRKSFGENFMAFSALRMRYPNAVLYVHADPSASMGGYTLPALAQACGLAPEAVIFPDPMQYRLGYSDRDMAALYSAFDVLLHANMGEGFGLTALEAQACETPVITSSWAASPDLVSEDCYLIEGQPWWDEAQKAMMQIPFIPSILAALEESYKRGRFRSIASREFAKQFDADKVFTEKWLPFFREYFA